jgi:hypothetical protein
MKENNSAIKELAENLTPKEIRLVQIADELFHLEEEEGKSKGEKEQIKLKEKINELKKEREGLLGKKGDNNKIEEKDSIYEAQRTKIEKRRQDELGCGRTYYFKKDDYGLIRNFINKDKRLKQTFNLPDEAIDKIDVAKSGKEEAQILEEYNPGYYFTNSSYGVHTIPDITNDAFESLNIKYPTTEEINAKYDKELTELDRKFNKNKDGKKEETPVDDKSEGVKNEGKEGILINPEEGKDKNIKEEKNANKEGSVGEDSEESESDGFEEDLTEKDEEILNQLLKTIEKTGKRIKEIGEEMERRKNQEEKATETNENNQEKKPQIPIATEVFNEKRSIKDSSDKEITIGDIVVTNGRDCKVVGFYEQKIEPRYIKPGGKEYNLYAELAEINKGEINFNSRSVVLDGEVTLKEKWQPKYNNGEVIKINDIVMADVEKSLFEIYNKKLKVIGFNLDGFVSVEVLEDGSRRSVNPSVMKTLDKEELQENALEKPKIFYAEAPSEEDGSFNIERTSEWRIPDISVFKFTQTSPDTAEFELIDDPNVRQRAIKLYYTLLKPVVENGVGYDQHATAMTLKISKGTMKKKENKWVPVDKLVIKEMGHWK